MSRKQALLEAGYTPSSAEKPNDVFGREDVKAEIQRRQRIMSEKSSVDAHWVIERLRAIADAKASDLMVLDAEGLPRTDMTRMTPALKVALESYTVAGDRIVIKSADKLRALEMLARHLGLFQDKLQLEGELSLVERLQQGRKRASARNEENVETYNPDDDVDDDA